MNESGEFAVSKAYFSCRQMSRRKTIEIHTDTNDEAENAYARDDIFDEVGLAGTNKCSSLTEVFVIIGRSRDAVDAKLVMK